MINKLLGVVSVFCLTYTVNAQIDYNVMPDVTSTILINDVHIQKSPLDSFGLGDILIEDGIIKQVAREIEAPYDARIIEADSAFAYSAFIDPLSHTGIPETKNAGERPQVKFPGYPPNDVAGITPEKEGIQLLDPKDSSISSWREAGYAIVHTVPRGRMLPGMGALISLQGDKASDMILKENTSMFFQFRGSRGFYPATVIGVMAKWRDMYKKSIYLNKHEEVYKTRSAGMARPTSDQSVEALIPVSSNQMPVFMKVQKSKDVFRALALQKELGYKLVIGGVQQITPALPKLKNTGVQVLLSADLPKEGKSDEKKKDKKSKKEKSDKEKLDKEAKESKDKKEKEKKSEDDPETKALKKKKKESYDAYVAQAAMLEKENIPFAFSMIDVKSKDLKSNIIKMIEAGLSIEKALSGLTTEPAKILGIDKIAGTIENGKLANIMISDKPYFQKESAIRYVFVEGHMTEIEKKEKKKSGASSSEGTLKESLIGTWSFTVEIPGETQSGNMTISEDGKIEVVADNSPDETDVADDIQFDEDNVTFDLSINNNGLQMILSFDLEFDGDSYEGMVDVGEFGSFPISGSKISSPE
jgi:hypothetical protein